MGWMLDLGAIQRETRWGLNYDANDYVFVINDSSSRLISIGSNYYAPKIEGDFSRYYYDSAAKSWIVTAKNGTKYYFGTTSASRQDDPTDANRIFKWCLDRVQDTNGNYMEVFYTKDQGQIYLGEIKYTGNINGLSPANSIEFILDPSSPRRTDAYEIYTTHFPVKTAQRLKTIEIYGNGQLARKYELNYTYSNSTLRSLLTSVTLYGSNGGTLPPVTFAYSRIGYGFSSAMDEVLQWHSPVLEGSSNYYFPQYVRYNRVTPLGNIVGGADILDINADGLPDRVTPTWLGGNHLNKGSYFLDGDAGGVPFERSGAIDYGLWCIGTETIDIDGDGIPEVVDGSSLPITNGSWYCSGSFGRIISTDSSGTYQDLIDMNGDGRLDRVTSNPSRSGNTIWVYLNTSNGFSSTPIYWNTPVTNSGWGQDVRSSDSSGTYQDIIDMNGDGLPDRVTSTPSRNGNTILVYLNTGSGFSSTPIYWNTPVVNSSWNQDVRSSDSNGTYQGIIDMNADGLPDRVTSNVSRNGSYLWVYLNTGSGFSNTPIQWNTPVTNSSWSHDVITVANNYGRTLQDIFDINGDGLPDRVTSPANPGTAGSATPPPDYFWVYPSKGLFPDFLTEIKNGLGGATQIFYTPSTRYTNTYMPFIQQLVSRVTVSDERGNSSTTTFDYSGGYYSATEKEFRGFQYVKSVAPNGTTTETWFKQDDIFKGLVDEQKVTDSSGNIYTWIYNTYNSSTPPPYTGVDYPYLSQKDEYIYDGDNVSTPRHIINTFTYDDYGNMTSKYEAEDPLKGDEKTEHTEYYYDLANWLVSLPQTQYVTDKNGVIEAQTWYEYYPDNKGNLWKKTQWLDGGTNPIITYTYDDYGNVWTITDPKNNPPTIITYDTATYTYPWKITNALNQMTEKTYDYRFGKIHTETDPNGNTIIYDYDEFGRLEIVTNPAPYGITEYLYQNYGNPDNQRVREEVKDRNGSLVHFKETYFDGLGRTTTERAGGSEARTIIVNTEYNNKGLVYRKSYPYFDGDPVYKITYTYDPVDRLTQTLNPDTTYSTISYMKGRVTYTDANGHKKVAEKDIYGRIIRVEEYTGVYPTFTPNPAITTYEYSVLGDLTKVIDANNNQTTITYDSLSRKTSMNDPDMGHWEYNYDANGNLTYQKDAKLQEITFEYDELNRITKKIYPDTTFIEYKYDETFSTNSKGRLTTLIDSSGTTKFFYDELGQITKTEKTISSTTYVTQTQYDELGRVKKLIYPDYTEVDYTYDGNGNIKDIKSGSQTYVTYNEYTAIANPKSVTYGNGVNTTYQYYSQNNRLFSITTNSGLTGLMNLAYYYDNVGNITKIIDYLDSTKTRDYKYDDLDRLIEADSLSYGGKLLYQYDKIGNMTYNCKYGYYYYDDPKHVGSVNFSV